jgi:hypothetical protein
LPGSLLGVQASQHAIALLNASVWRFSEPLFCQLQADQVE